MEFESKIVPKIIVCGSRGFNDQELFDKEIKNFTASFDDLRVVLGKCPTGADEFGKRWAGENRYLRFFFPPNWDKFGRRAGMIRNWDMAKFVAPNGWCIAFWDSKSPGIANMIKQFLKRNPSNHLKVVKYTNEE